MVQYECLACGRAMDPTAIPGHRDDHDEPIDFKRADPRDEWYPHHVPPASGPDYVTVSVQGQPVDLGPDATVDNALGVYRYAIGAKATNLPSTRRHGIVPSRYGVVREADVGRDEDGDLRLPESEADFVPWDLEGVRDGDRLYIYGLGGTFNPYADHVDD